MAEDKHIHYFGKGFGWNLCCKQATYLLLKKEEVKELSFKEEMGLKFHLFICKFCRAFKSQSQLMNEAIHNVLHTEKNLSRQQKESLRQLINNNL